MKKSLLSLLILTAFTYRITAQNVTIPDVNFKDYLVSNTAINTNADSEIQISEANAFSGAILCNALSISDLTGIETFTALTELRCHANALTALNISQNTALTYLSCYSNNLTSLVVSQNTHLTVLSCHTNNLSSLDIYQNTNLTVLSCSNNSITSLDVSQNTALANLICLNNSLIALNVANGNNINFTQFNSTGNPNLECIEVDDVAWSTANWTNIDINSSFSASCGTLGTEEKANISGLSIYPNPANSHITLDTKELIETINIYNLMGELVLTKTTLSFNLEDIPNGIYILKLKTNNGTIAKRFMKKE